MSFIFPQSKHSRVDVERNLQSPLVGISQAARRMGVEHYTPTVTIPGLEIRRQPSARDSCAILRTFW